MIIDKGGIVLSVLYVELGFAPRPRREISSDWNCYLCVGFREGSRRGRGVFRRGCGEVILGYELRDDN